MVQAIDFAVRDSAGGKQHGSVAGDGQGNFIQIGSGDSVSLNLAKESIVAYEQQGNDLLIKLSDGRSVVLSNYFHETAGQMNHLYISSEGEMTEVLVHQNTDGALFADYGPVSGWDKWSPLDDLRFTTADSVSDAVYVSNEPAGMAPFIPGLLGGFGGAGAAAAALGAAAVVGAGSGGGSGSSGGDTTPPALTINQGTDTVHHVETGQDYTNGVQIGGTTEPGATVSVVVNGNTQTTKAGDDGVWEVTFPKTEVDPGQYTIPVVVTATDAAGNSTTASDTLVVDTVVEPFTHTITNTSSHVADSVLNADEAAEGLTVGGAVEAGSTVQVRLGDGSYHAATVVDGNWSYTFSPSEITSGDLHAMTMTAIATDKYGNVSAPLTGNVSIDTLVSNFAHTSTDTSSIKTDSVLNGAEAQSGLTIGGTVEPGSSVMVKLGDGIYHAASVTNGSWTYTFSASEVTQGDLHSMPITAVATDAYGNVSAPITSNVSVDTLVSNFAITYTDTSSVVADSVLNGAEAQSGLRIGGTVEAGSTVMVKLGDGSYHQASVSNGTWTYTFPPGDVTQGDLHAMPITAIATDAYGNVSQTLSSNVAVDTLVSNFAHTHSDTSSNLADAILNRVEADSGLTVGGTVEAGSSVMVKLDNGAYHQAQVSNGVWSYTFATNEISAGDMHTARLTAVATDAYGNVSAPISSDIKVDTLVSNFHSTSTPLAGDGMLNAAEAAAGMTVSGTAEAGSHIVVHMQNGSEMTTTAAANGSWSVVFDAAHLPSGEGAGATSSITVTATDIAGNVAHYDQSFTYDTVAPADPWVTNDAGTGNVISGIAIAATDDAVSYHSIAATGGAHQLQTTATFEAGVDVHGSNVASEWAFFTNPVPDGSYLVVRDTDMAGNESSTLYIRSTTGETTVDLSRAGLSDFDFGTIDLTASHANLTLTATQLNALTGPDKSMTISGGVDDHVTLVGATDTHTTQTLHGEAYHVFTLGSDGASVLIDSDIIVNNTGV